MTNVTPDEAPLPEDLPDLFAEIMRRLEVESAELDRKAEAGAVERAVVEAERAEKARNGDLGSDWAAIQRRIDLNQTSLEAVFSGEDGSNEAASLRDLSQKNLTQLREQWETLEEAGESDDEPSPLEEMNSLSAESRERHQAAAQQIAAMLEQSGLNQFTEKP